MARTKVVVTRVSRTNPVTVATSSAATLDSVNGSYVPNDGATVLLMYNASGGTATVTILAPEDVDEDLVVGSRTYSLSNTLTYLAGYFPEDVYGSQLLVNVTAANVHVLAYSTR